MTKKRLSTVTSVVKQDLVIRESAKKGLVATRDYLAKPGHWTRNEEKLGGKTMCLLMALDYNIRYPDGGSTFYPPSTEACAAYDLAFGILQDDLLPNRNVMMTLTELMRWNDHPKRKKKEVLDLLNRAIDKL